MISMRQIAAYWGGPRYRGSVDDPLHERIAEKGEEFDASVPRAIRNALYDWAHARPGDEAGAAADLVIAALDEHGAYVNPEFRSDDAPTGRDPIRGEALIHASNLEDLPMVASEDKPAVDAAVAFLRRIAGIDS